jgi:hypothetical protein
MLSLTCARFVESGTADEVMADIDYEVPAGGNLDYLDVECGDGCVAVVWSLPSP